MSGIPFNRLKSETDSFFLLHWPRSKWNNSPEWTNPWYLHGAMKGGDKQGVYALLDGKREVIYIGVGASLGGGAYEGFGLGARTGRYTRVAPDQKGLPIQERRYIPSPEWKVRGLVAITTVCFEINKAYLAYGLEAFLLSKVSPPFNKIRAARNTNA